MLTNRRRSVLEKGTPLVLQGSVYVSACSEYEVAISCTNPSWSTYI